VVPSVVSYVHKHTAAHPRPWLVLGKGPTAERMSDLDTSKYHFLTLNHACRLVVPDVAHFVDIEAYNDCAAYLDTVLQARVCLPWHPHVGNRAAKPDLLQYGIPDRRLVSYNATTAGKLSRMPGLPTVRLRFFSAVAAFNILGHAGVREVYSLGVDGGTAYAPAFDHKDKLRNGRDTFDDQFGEIEYAVKSHKLNWTKL